MRSNLVESVINLHCCELLFSEQVLVEGGQIIYTIVRYHFQSCFIQDSEPVINVMHSFRTIHFVVGNNVILRVFHITSIPFAIITKDRHQSKLLIPQEYPLNGQIVALEIGVPVKNKKILP